MTGPNWTSPPNHCPPPAVPPHNPGITFLGLTGGILAIVVTLSIVVPIAIVLVCCGAGLFGIANAPTATPSP